MGKIAYVELKLYVNDLNQLQITNELNRLMKFSKSILISSFKSIEILDQPEIDFNMNKFFETGEKT